MKEARKEVYPSRTVKQAAARCRKAWDAHPEATHGWCIHHQKRAEPLSDPIVDRVKYVLTDKAKSELITRLDNMRPVLSAAAREAISVYQKARKHTWDEERRARSAMNNALRRIHRREVPHHTWSDGSIFNNI